MQFLKLFFITILLGFTFTQTVFAATLSLDPKTGSFGPGDTFVLTVRLDLEQDECVNAATVSLQYPSEWIKASAVSKGESFLTLWTDEPSVNHETGVVSFSGGIPGGYCGRVLGDPGKTNILGKIVFSVHGNMIGGKVATGPVSLPLSFLPSSAILQNDGLGTPAPLLLHDGIYTRTLESSGASNEWLDIVHEDTIPPDIFSATIVQDPKTFQGKYFLVFSAVDKQSGVHHFEIQEDDPEHFGMMRGVRGERARFVTAESPYVLRDQELGSRIIVRAIDHAGNVQETLLPPRGDVGAVYHGKERSPLSKNLWYIFGFFVAVSSLAISVYVVRRYYKKSSDDFDKE